MVLVKTSPMLPELTFDGKREEKLCRIEDLMLTVGVYDTGVLDWVCVGRVPYWVWFPGDNQITEASVYFTRSPLICEQKVNNGSISHHVSCPHIFP